MLPPIQLADTGRMTSQLGLGCSGLGGSVGEREAARMLEIAYDAGIRHFDVAPSYGHGAAERCLGGFLRGRHSNVTVTTKYGILPPRQGSVLDAARTLARPIARQWPSLRKRISRTADGMKGHADFSVGQARASLERSLRELGLERVDLFLLHEATAQDLTDGALLEFMEAEVQRGRIGTFGIGSNAECVPEIWEKRRRYCRVLQYEMPPFTAEPTPYPGAFLIHHRVVQEYFLKISVQLAQNKNLARIWSDALDCDLADRKNLAALLLKAALVAYPDRIVLFSSRVPAHIEANSRIAADPCWNERARCFLELISNRDDAGFLK